MVPVKIKIGDKTTIDALGKGTIKFEAAVDGKWLLCYMENVLYVPHARRNLFSVISALDKGMTFNSSKTVYVFIMNGTVKAQGVRISKMFKMEIREKPPPMPKIR